ncbi:hypothetical protein PFICI_08643 [Pestalotiopsis fici W106-1]|uniref:Zn(2)-C6 fungal-type domain-containing protein n=1 Tax=Pestalotiopsis fici (strain W106-1 / CGMCC3.15140) TaxID=1229662 RepID=W3WY76_PESFW|nr:uncharacterized protein PFICI_08643 [Pestalotiopsis fici W106-1]ETS78790.1 hypothetical protein PFICI_08643 [Pestalotiopsis fici W106-1]
MSSTSKARKRACDSCYRRKIQCDAESPKCNWCSHHSLDCTFNRPTRVKKTAKSKKEPRPEGLSQRIERLEQFLANKITQQQDDRPEPAAESQQSASCGSSSNSQVDSPGRLGDQAFSCPDSAIGSFGKLHFAGYHLGEISLGNGVPLFSSGGRRWIESQTGQSLGFAQLDLPLWHNHDRDHDAFASPSDTELPDLKVTEEYYNFFCNGHIRYVFPIVDTELFKQTIAAAYEPPGRGPRYQHARAKACVLSFLSIISFMEPSANVTPVDCNACALKAQYLLPQVMVDTSLDGLQIAFMQGMFNMFSGLFEKAVMFHALACRIVLILGGHTQAIDPSSPRPDSETENSWRIKCHIRKYFWMCYSFDKDAAIRSGHPPAISDEHCNLTLPSQYSDPNQELRIDSVGNPFLPGDLRLALIKSKAGRLLYSAQALLKSDAELLRDIRELDDELEEWRMAISPSYRPSLSYRESDGGINHNLSVSEKMHHIITNFEYHYLVATIHQATSRCRSWDNRDSGESEGVSSSLALSVEASRSTLLYLRTAVEALAGESFWMVIFYPMTAILTIFCNILLNPLCSRANEDLELLRTAPHFIKNIRIPRLTENEISHMKMIEDFVAELIRLGSHAILKAQGAQQSFPHHILSHESP